MDADFLIELGHDDPILDFPWTDPDGKLHYFDLKRHPELVSKMEEAKQFPELGDFLHLVNSAMSIVESAKCDAWSTTDLTPEEEIYGVPHKCASYVDLLFSDATHRQSFGVHEHFAKELIQLLRRAPETPSAVELCVRRCLCRAEDETREGFYYTLYVSGYGKEEARARQNWGIALKLTGNAILQLSAAGL